MGMQNSASCIEKMFIKVHLYLSSNCKSHFKNSGKHCKAFKTKKLDNIWPNYEKDRQHLIEIYENLTKYSNNLIILTNSKKEGKKKEKRYCTNVSFDLRSIHYLLNNSTIHFPFFTYYVSYALCNSGTYN